MLYQSELDHEYQIRSSQCATQHTGRSIADSSALAACVQEAWSSSQVSAAETSARDFVDNQLPAIVRTAALKGEFDIPVMQLGSEPSPFDQQVLTDIKALGYDADIRQVMVPNARYDDDAPVPVMYIHLPHK